MQTQGTLQIWRRRIVPMFSGFAVHLYCPFAFTQVTHGRRPILRTLQPTASAVHRGRGSIVRTLQPTASAVPEQLIDSQVIYLRLVSWMPLWYHLNISSGRLQTHFAIYTKTSIHLVTLGAKRKVPLKLLLADCFASNWLPQCVGSAEFFYWRSLLTLLKPAPDKRA